MGIVAVRPGICPGDHQRGSKFSQRARERKNRARKHSGPRERQRNFAKHAPFARPECARGLQKMSVHLLDSLSPGSQIHQGKSDNGRRNHRGWPGENHRGPQMI